MQVTKKRVRDLQVGEKEEKKRAPAGGSNSEPGLRQLSLNEEGLLRPVIKPAISGDMWASRSNKQQSRRQALANGFANVPTVPCQHGIRIVEPLVRGVCAQPGRPTRRAYMRVAVEKARRLVRMAVPDRQCHRRQPARSLWCSKQVGAAWRRSPRSAAPRPW